MFAVHGILLTEIYFKCHQNFYFQMKKILKMNNLFQIHFHTSCHHFIWQNMNLHYEIINEKCLGLEIYVIQFHGSNIFHESEEKLKEMSLEVIVLVLQLLC